METFVIILIISLAVFVGYKIFRNYKVNEFSKKMFEATSKNDEELFLSVVNNQLAKWFISPYYMNLAKIKFYSVNQYSKNLEELTDGILSSKVRLKEKVGLLNPIFSYFIENKNEKYAEKVYEGLSDCLKSTDNGQVYIEELQLLMDIYIHPNTKRIAELQKLIDATDSEAKEVCQYRLAALYINLNRKSDAKKVLDEIHKNTKNLDSYNSFISKNMKD